MSEIEFSVVDIEREIGEIEEMITHFLCLKELHPDCDVYKEEIAYWRKSLQQAKILKREVLAAT